jgi:hypothetical protein
MPSPSRGLQAVRDLDPLHGLRAALAQVADEKAEWAGIPMPLEGERLIVEPSYPYAAIGEINAPKPSEDDGWRLRNRWYSHAKRCDILIMERDGKIGWGLVPGIHAGRHMMATLGCADAWGIEQEARAVQLLAEKVRHRQFKQYMLTGMFLERSKRSGVMYLFRRLRPTIALSPHGDDARILAALCMHPIAYYANSWAGAMCPTDDVIAHLMMMRADEHMFWKRCNQHPPHRPEAGL